MRNNSLSRYFNSMNESIHRSVEYVAEKVQAALERWRPKLLNAGADLVEGGKLLGRAVASDRLTRNIVIVVLGVVVVAGLLIRHQSSAVQEGIPVYTVKPDLFQMKILERGTLKSVRNVMISSGITGDRGKILELFPEGNYVEKNQLLVKFDRTSFLDEIERAKTELERAKAELIQAQEEVKVERARIDENLKRGADEITLAELALKDLQEGAGPLKLQKAKFAVSKYKGEFEKLDKDFIEFKALVKEGYVSQSELNSIERRRDEAKSAFEFAQAEYDNLVNFSHPTDLETAKAKVRAVKESFDKLKETAQYSIASKEASVNRAFANINSAQTKINIARDQLKQSEVRAPVGGFVIYPEIFIAGSSDKRKVEVGDSVFPTQAFMFIPDTSQMFVDTQIREVDIYKAKSGQEATIRVDAYPDLVLKGTVALVGTLAEGKQGDGAGGKYFNLQISLNDTDSRLRPGMTARVEILVHEEKDVLMVPMEAVSEKHGRKVVYVRNRGVVEQREIGTDKSNADFVVVRSGLAPGDQVLLLDPTKEMNTFEKRMEVPRTAPSPVSAPPAPSADPSPATEGDTPGDG